MAQQPDISAILAALAQRPNGTPTPSSQSTSAAAQTAGYPGVVSAASPANPMAGVPLPQPTNSGSLDLSSIKPASTGNVSLADAIAKARGMAAEKASSREDPRLAGRAYKRSRSRSRSPMRRESYRDSYNPYRDERRDESRRASNGRDRSFSPSNRAAAPYSPSNARDFRSPSGNDSSTEVITVDSSSVGLIIGRAGENLRRVESETGARVQFLTSTDPTGLKRQCKVTGTARQRSEAIHDIFRVVAENAASGRGSTGQNNGASRGASSSVQSSQPAQREADRTIQIMVPDRTVGLIIGRGGETIRDLQERSGCHVNIVGENKSINGLRPVNLIGSREAAAKAKELILEVVDSDTRTGAGSQPPAVSQPYGRAPSAYDPYSGGYPPPPPVAYDNGARITDMMTVPSEAVGMIIGKGGETIKEMQNSTSCKINVSPPSAPDINREIGLIGTRSAIENAKRQIWDKVGTVREKQGGRIGGEPPPSAAMPYDPYAPHQPPPYAQPAGPVPPAQAMPPAPDQSDPYAAYGGYQNYMAMWWSAMAHQGGPPGGPPPGA